MNQCFNSFSVQHRKGSQWERSPSSIDGEALWSLLFPNEYYMGDPFCLDLLGNSLFFISQILTRSKSQTLRPGFFRKQHTDIFSHDINEMQPVPTLTHPNDHSKWFSTLSWYWWLFLDMCGLFCQSWFPFACDVCSILVSLCSNLKWRSIFVCRIRTFLCFVVFTINASFHGYISSSATIDSGGSVPVAIHRWVLI